MKHRLSIFTLVLAASLQLTFTAKSQTEVTAPVGFTTTSLLANSDTLINVPFFRTAEFAGAVQSITGNVITVAGGPAWTGNQFVYAANTQPNTYFVLIGDGGSSNPKEGHFYTITANGSNTLTVDTTNDNLTGITANTSLMVIPYWTLSTIFPDAKMNVSFTPTTTTSSYKTQVLVPNNSANGINLPSTTYFFSNNVNGSSGNIGWRILGDNTTNHGDDPLMPNSYFNVRNLNGAPTLPLRGLGSVVTGKVATILRTAAATQQDNDVSMVRPVGVTLNQSGLGPGDGSFVATVRLNQLKDQLLIFNNAQARHNKKPSAMYIYYGGTSGSPGWKKKGAGTSDHGNDVIPAGSAIVIRKARTTSGDSVVWTNSPTY